MKKEHAKDAKNTKHTKHNAPIEFVTTQNSERSFIRREGEETLGMAEPSTERQSSTSSRQTTNPRDSTPTVNPNIFSDDFALEPFEICNGFRPSLSEGNGEPSNPSSEVQVRPQNRVISGPPSEPQEMFQRNRESLRRGESGSSRRERTSLQTFPHSPNVGSAADTATPRSTSERPTSNASIPFTPPVETPYRGATGPSQPYGMYPQDIALTRTVSAATNTTVRMPERSYTGPNGPTQPYGMYPQNTVTEDESSPSPDAISPVPGFPSQEQNYQRRFGPDSEEAADIVGPDGYTEQLPPYTRYANDIPPKSALAGPSNSGRGPSIQPTPERINQLRAEPINQPRAELVGQLGGSQDTLNTAQSGDTVVRSPATDDSTTQINPSAGHSAVPAEAGGHFKERIKEKGKKRICFGKIPMWILMTFLLICAVLVGAVIGGVLRRAGDDSSEDEIDSEIEQVAATPIVYATITRTSLVDAVPITPTSAMPSIPTGSYKVLLPEPTISKRDCILDSEQQNAWECNRGAVMQLNINTLDRDKMEATFSNVDEDSNDFTKRVRYGAHPPEISDFVSMALMNATDHKDEGPAYVFHQPFHKVVVLSEEDFSPFLDKREPVGWSSDEHAKAGQKPWFCFWNDTLIEGFIFVNSNTTAATDSAALADTIILSDSLGATKTPGQAPSSIDLEHYTKIVKIEERRNWDNPIPPYCQQMLIHEDGIARPITDRGGSRIELHVKETDKFPRVGKSKRRRGWFEKPSNFEKRSKDSLSACSCAWMIEQGSVTIRGRSQ